MDKNTKEKLYNTRQLLKHYTYLKKHTSLQDVAAEDSNIPYMNGVRDSKDKTLKAIDYIDKIIDQYKELTYSESLESKRRYDTIYYMYLSDNSMTIEQIAEINSCSLKTVTRDRDKAITELAVLLFGIDGLELKY